MSDATIYQLTIPGDFGPVTLCISTDGRAIQAAARREVASYGRPETDLRVTAWRDGQPRDGRPQETWMALADDWLVGDHDSGADVGDEADIASAVTRTVREVAREGGVDPRHVKITFRERFGDVQPVEVRVRMRASGGRGHKAWAEGFGSGVWEAAAIAFAEVESRKAANWIVGDGDR